MTNQPLLPTVEIEPADPATHAVVWLHGLGANGHDFEPAVPYLRLPHDAAVRFVFPHAPSIAVTLNGGMVMPAWYDIVEVDLERHHDLDGVRRSAARVARLIAREGDRGIPPARVFLAGFSQGGAVALHLGVRYEKRLLGIIALSAYLTDDEKAIAAERSAANRATPILIAHGKLDPMVPIERGARARDVLTRLEYPVTFHDYLMQHQVCDEELAEIGRFIVRRMGADADDS